MSVRIRRKKCSTPVVLVGRRSFYFHSEEDVSTVPYLLSQLPVVCTLAIPDHIATLDPSLRSIRL